MAKIPDDLKYAKTHEWVKVAGPEVIIGITDYAQSELSDVVYVELPQPGKLVKTGEPFGTIEAVKAVSDLYAPVSGEITAVNTELKTAPDAVNKDPYGKGWMIKMKLSDPKELDSLLSAADYNQTIEKHD
jgi:glycine cleavage system H protein